MRSNTSCGLVLYCVGKTLILLINIIYSYVYGKHPNKGSQELSIQGPQITGLAEIVVLKVLRCVVHKEQRV